MEFLGLRSLIYPTQNLDESKKWWKNYLGVDPYFDEPFYVGFDISGYELGLSPGGSIEHGPVTYIGVDSMTEAIKNAEAHGVTLESPAQDVGGGIQVATLISPTGERFGLIVNPNFRL